MKKILLLAGIAFTLASCGNQTETEVTDVDTMLTDTGAVVTETTTTVYTNYADGDVTYKDGKWHVWSNGAWVPAQNDVTLDDGTVIATNGKVTREGKVVDVEIKEGTVINKAGRWFDATGNAIENAWDATKEGVRNAGEAIKEGAQKVGDKTNEVVNDIKN